MRFQGRGADRGLVLFIYLGWVGVKSNKSSYLGPSSDFGSEEFSSVWFILCNFYRICCLASKQSRKVLSFKGFVKNLNRTLTKLTQHIRYYEAKPCWIKEFLNRG